MHKEYILLNGFRKAKKGFNAGFHVPLSQDPESYIAVKSLGIRAQRCFNTKGLASRRDQVVNR